MEIRRKMVAMDIATNIAAAGFVQPATQMLYHDVQNHLLGGETVYEIVVGGRVAGFTIFCVFGDVLYLSGIILEPDVQGCGIAQRAIHRARQDSTRCGYLALRTQSSRMWSVGHKMCSRWYPNMTHQPPDDIVQVGRLVTDHVRSDFPVQVGHYGGPLYGKKPIHHDVTLQVWWDDLCDFDRGDAVLCVGKF